MAVTRVGIAVVLGLVLAAGVNAARDPGEPVVRVPASTTTTHAPLPADPRGEVYELPVRMADDVGKAGQVRSVLGYKPMDAEVDGESPDQLRFVFDHPAEILSVGISVDVTDTRLHLVEVMVGVNIDGYGEDRRGDPLLHASWVDHGKEGAGGAIDQTYTLPHPMQVAAGEYVGAGAWLGGDMPARIVPEVVVVYRWL